MILRKSYIYQLKTKPEHEALLPQFVGSCRFLWNKALALQKERLDAKQGILRYNSLAMLLPVWKDEHAFLKDAPSQALQQVLKNLDRALLDAFDPKSTKQFPTFKKKFVSRDSLRYPQGFKIEAQRIFLPKLGWVAYRNSRPIEGTPKNVTVARNGRHWQVSIQTEREVAEPIHPSTSTVGIDRGVAVFAALSDGTMYQPLDAFRNLEAKLAKEQRKLSRKVKKSRNWQKQKRKVGDIHRRIANARKDYLQKVSTEISKNHAVTVMELLKVQNMTASAKGTADKPGRNVKQKAGLNKAILDQGWGTLRLLLEQKQAERGGKVIYINPAYTSQTCSCCGHVHPGNRQSQSQFHCQSCGLTMNADLNAACNIKGAGQALLACQANGAAMPSAAGTSKLAA